MITTGYLVMLPLITNISDNNAMELSIIVIAGLMGTSFMTIFSQILGKVMGQNFNEAELINKLLNRRGRTYHYLGWYIHYAIGFIFAAGLRALYLLTEFERYIIIGIPIGLGLGAFGGMCWYIFFFKKTETPNLEFKNFFGQLLIAHVIFTVVVLSIFQIMNQL